MKNMDKKTLIALVEEQELLYNKLSPLYHDSDARNDAWKLISAQLDLTGKLLYC